MHTRLGGFTLLEALIALATAAVLLALAVPAASAAAAKVYSAQAQAAIATTLFDAMNHATVTSTEVVVCPSSDGIVCHSGTDWSNGWLVFADLDGNRQHSPNETSVLHQPALGGGVRLRSTTGRRLLVFQPDGSNAGSNVTFTLCDRRGPRAARTLVLANNGNLRHGQPTFNAAAQCVYGSG